MRRALVTAVREMLSTQGYAQNPCLECSATLADVAFLH